MSWGAKHTKPKEEGEPKPKKSPRLNRTEDMEVHFRSKKKPRTEEQVRHSGSRDALQESFNRIN